MGRKSLGRVHKDLQRERIKREVLKYVERKSIPEISMGVKGAVLLALKKKDEDNREPSDCGTPLKKSRWIFWKVVLPGRMYSTR